MYKTEQNTKNFSYEILRNPTPACYIQTHKVHLMNLYVNVALKAIRYYFMVWDKNR